MTKRLPRFDSHVAAFYDFQAGQEAAAQAAKERAEGLPFFFVLTPADSYATVYDSDHIAARPVGTVTRPRLFGEAAAKLWTVAAPDGSEVYRGPFRPSARAVTNYLLRHAAKAEEAAKAAAMEAEESATQARRAADLAPAIESGPVGPDWQGNGPAESFYAQAPALPNGRPGPFAFGPSEEAAREALARVMAPAPEEAPRPLSDLLEEEAGAKAAAHICRPLVADLAQESGPFPRALTPEEQEAAARFEVAAEEAEGRKDWRAAALAWAEGAKLCRIAGQNDSATLWEGHCRRAAGEAFKAAAKARRAMTPKPAPRTFAGFPARFGA